MNKAEEKLKFLEDVFKDKPNQQIQQPSVNIPSLQSLDPRPDHTQDNHHWELILTNAKALFDNNPQPVNRFGKTTLFKILHGLRCGGARLEETKQAYKLHPGDEEFADPEEWEQTKRDWLNPVKDDLVRLFKLCKIGRATEEELPEEVAKAFKNEKQPLEEEQQKLFGGR
jgi:hypothetical protein